MTIDQKIPILVTGATGYIGGRLVPRLLEGGYSVRCLVRDASRLQGRPWLDKVEVYLGDALESETLRAAMQNVKVAYYLIHGLQGGRHKAERDLQAARNFAQAAESAGLERIIYLGELVDPSANLSPYLRARHETGYILRQGGVPVTELRAGMVIGSGSLLFEMIRYLTEHQPLLVCPRWFYTTAQPIAIRNVLDYLLAVLESPASLGKLIEIGGVDRLSYAQMCRVYAEVRGFKRSLVPVPVYAPRLSAWWVHMLTPLHWRALLPLIEGLHAESIVQDDIARMLFPTIELLDFKTAVSLALGRVANDNVETSWADALVTSAGDRRPYIFSQQEGMMIEERRKVVDLPPEIIFSTFTGLGGNRGWLYMDWLWEIRGWMDKVVGGVGLRRGRRSPDELYVGEALDFWRVEAIEPGRMMRLRAEMRVPGKAWLQFETTPMADRQTLLTQTAYFAPRGLAGLLYWYSMYPFHLFIFSGMLNKVAKRAALLANGKDKETQQAVEADAQETILVTGASGYIASQLIPQLLAKGKKVRCLVRNPAHLDNRSWCRQVEIYKGDLTQPESYLSAMTGVSQAYYLVHGMSNGKHYIDLDLQAARDFSSSARTAGVKHIIYLGGLADPTVKIARHMRSRIHTGEALRSGGIPVTEFRAGVIIGPGSISFEMIRFLAEQFPIIPCPRWMTNLSQPISIQNTLDYLLAALEAASLESRVFEIGGSEVMSYAETMLAYARLRGLKRRVLMMPINPVGVLAYGMALLTPVPKNITRPLVEGLCSHSLVQDDSARQIFPHIQPLDYSSAVRTSLEKLDPQLVEPVWRQSSPLRRSLKHAGFCIRQRRDKMSGKFDAMVATIREMGQEDGKSSLINDTEHESRYGREQILLMRSNRKLPGQLWREWRMSEIEGGSQLNQTILFAPKGLPGFLWWYLGGFTQQFQMINWFGKIRGRVRRSQT
jgi:uncharacterized protein YbjT (DUF2867 family)